MLNEENFVRGKYPGSEGIYCLKYIKIHLDDISKAENMFDQFLSG